MSKIIHWCMCKPNAKGKNLWLLFWWKSHRYVLVIHAVVKLGWDLIQVSWQKLPSPKINKGKNYWKSFKWQNCFIENWEWSIYVLNWLVNGKNLLIDLFNQNTCSYVRLLSATILQRAENWPMFFWDTKSLTTNSKQCYWIEKAEQNFWDRLCFKEECLGVISI